MSIIEAQKVLLTRVALADGPIRNAEIETAIAIANMIGGIGKVTRRDVVKQVAYLSRSDLTAAIKQVVLLSDRQRLRLVGLMWVLAACDGPINADEEAAILDMCEKIGVAREAAVAQRQEAGINVSTNLEKG